MDGWDIEDTIEETIIYFENEVLKDKYLIEIGFKNSTIYLKYVLMTNNSFTLIGMAFGCNLQTLWNHGGLNSLQLATVEDHLEAYSFKSTLRPRQNGRHFADDIFKCIFLNENVWISSKIFSIKINNIPALVQVMAWRRPGNKPLYEPTMVSLLTHICVTRPQWVNGSWIIDAHAFNCQLGGSSFEPLVLFSWDQRIANEKVSNEADHDILQIYGESLYA